MNAFKLSTSFPLYLDDRIRRIDVLNDRHDDVLGDKLCHWKWFEDGILQKKQQQLNHYFHYYFHFVSTLTGLGIITFL